MPPPTRTRRGARSALIAAGVALVALVVGVVVAGLPSSVPSDIAASEIIGAPATVALSPTTTAPPATTAAPTTVPPTTAPPTTAPATTAPPTTDAVTTTPPTTEPPAATDPPTTPATTEPPPSTASATTDAATTVRRTTSTTLPATTTSSTLAPVERLQVVVANATSYPGLAARTAGELAELGYGDVTPADAVTNRADSVIYYAPRFRGEALRLAADAGIPDDAVRRVPTGAVTVQEVDAEVWLIAGGDRV